MTHKIWSWFGANHSLISNILIFATLAAEIWCLLQMEFAFLLGVYAVRVQVSEIPDVRSHLGPRSRQK